MKLNITSLRVEGSFLNYSRHQWELVKKSTNVLNIYFVSDSVVRVKNTKTNRTIEALKMSY